jgi:hypothetical protein
LSFWEWFWIEDCCVQLCSWHSIVLLQIWAYPLTISIRVTLIDRASILTSIIMWWQLKRLYISILIWALHSCLCMLLFHFSFKWLIVQVLLGFCRFLSPLVIMIVLMMVIRFGVNQGVVMVGEEWLTILWVAIRLMILTIIRSWMVSLLINQTLLTQTIVRVTKSLIQAHMLLVPIWVSLIATH